MRGWTCGDSRNANLKFTHQRSDALLEKIPFDDLI